MVSWVYRGEVGGSGGWTAIPVPEIFSQGLIPNSPSDSFLDHSNCPTLRHRALCCPAPILIFPLIDEVQSCSEPLLVQLPCQCRVDFWTSLAPAPTLQKNPTTATNH